MYREVVLHDHRRLATAQLEIHEKGYEGIGRVRSRKYFIVDEASPLTDASDQRQGLSPHCR